MKYKVLKNLKHNGVNYTPGTEAVLAEDENTSKLATEGVIEKVVEVQVSAKESSQETAKPQEANSPIAKKPKRKQTRKN